jgi:retron-type reverse transcriptase
MNGHTRCKSEVGTPQGAVISPLLANIYLHYALDTWVVEWRLREARGEVYIIRYADDCVMGFQYQHDGERFKRAAETRLCQK